jgi:hypothetical protein
MNPWICALLIGIAGALGGLVNALMSNNGFALPQRVHGVWCPGAREFQTGRLPEEEIRHIPRRAVGLSVQRRWLCAWLNGHCSLHVEFRSSARSAPRMDLY